MFSPRSGRGLSFFSIFRGLVKCYNLSYALSFVLTFGGCIGVRKFWGITLQDINTNGPFRVAHNASLVHKDPAKGEKLSSIAIDKDMAEDFVGDIQPPVPRTKEVSLEDLKDVVVNEDDVARARVRLERNAPLAPANAELARGEMAIILGVWETEVQLPSSPQDPASTSPASTPRTKLGAPIAYLLNWLVQERLPEGWKPTHVQGLLNVMKRSRQMKKKSAEIRAQEASAPKTK